jgi:hypothetical protein
MNDHASELIQQIKEVTVDDDLVINKPEEVKPVLEKRKMDSRLNQEKNHIDNVFRKISDAIKLGKPNSNDELINYYVKKSIVQTIESLIVENFYKIKYYLSDDCIPIIQFWSKSGCYYETKNLALALNIKDNNKYDKTVKVFGSDYVVCNECHNKVEHGKDYGSFLAPSTFICSECLHKRNFEIDKENKSIYGVNKIQCCGCKKDSKIEDGEFIAPDKFECNECSKPKK